MSLATDETRMKRGLSRSAGIPAGLGRLELVCASAPHCSWGAAGSFVRGKPAGMPALRTTRGSARPIFIICDAACGMATEASAAAADWLAQDIGVQQEHIAFDSAELGHLPSRPAPQLAGFLKGGEKRRFVIQGIVSSSQRTHGRGRSGRQRHPRHQLIDGLAHPAQVRGREMSDFFKQTFSGRSHARNIVPAAPAAKRFFGVVDTSESNLFNGFPRF